MLTVAGRTYKQQHKQSRRTDSFWSLYGGVVIDGCPWVFLLFLQLDGLFHVIVEDCRIFFIRPVNPDAALVRVCRQVLRDGRVLHALAEVGEEPDDEAGAAVRAVAVLHAPPLGDVPYQVADVLTLDVHTLLPLPCAALGPVVPVIKPVLYLYPERQDVVLLQQRSHLPVEVVMDAFLQSLPRLFPGCSIILYALLINLGLSDMPRPFFFLSFFLLSFRLLPGLTKLFGKSIPPGPARLSASLFQQ